MVCSFQEMEKRRVRLCARFLQQQCFAAESSSLTACLCGIVAQWLNNPLENEKLGEWLVRASCHCPTVSVPMLLLASVHRAILADYPATRLLAAYFPTVGGFRSPLASELAPLFRQAVHACRQQLVSDFISSTVQTNESSRGLCWYLPLLYTGLTAVHLVDLGCSAGINLVADLRQYRLCANADGDSDICLGKGEGEPFVIAHHGAFFAPQQGTLPRVFSRLGCDRLPLRLNSQADELRLLSFVFHRDA